METINGTRANKNNTARLVEGDEHRQVRPWIICDVQTMITGCSPSVPSVLKKTQYGTMVLLTQSPSKLPIFYNFLPSPVNSLDDNSAAIIDRTLPKSEQWGELIYLQISSSHSVHCSHQDSSSLNLRCSHLSHEPQLWLIQLWLKEIKAVCGGESSLLLETKGHLGKKIALDICSPHREG